MSARPASRRSQRLAARWGAPGPYRSPPGRVAATAPTSDPTSSFWYDNGTGMVTYSPRSSAGFPVTPDSALTLAAVYRAVRLLADDVAQLPLHLFRRLPDRDHGMPGGKERVRNDLWDVVARRPNPRMTSFQWRQMAMAHVLLRGNHYSRIVSGARGAVDRLEPLVPWRMRVELLESGRSLFLYRAKDGREERLTQDEVHHIPGFTTDPESPEGMSVISLARTSLGLTMATEEFGARQFSQTPRPSFAVSTEQDLGHDRRLALEQSFRANFSGPSGYGGVPVMDRGLKVQNLGMSHDDAQYLQTRQHQVGDVARWFGVPPHKIGDLSRSSFANIEQEETSYVIHSLLPWLVLFEVSFERDLVLDDTFFEFVTDGLLRGDSLSRAQAQQIRANMKALTPNEVRAQENLNPVPWGDEPLETQGAPPPRAPESAAPPRRDSRSDDPEDDASAARHVNRLPHMNGNHRHE